MSDLLLDEMLAGDYELEENNKPAEHRAKESKEPKQKRTGAGGRITDADMRLLVFLSMFPASSLEDLRLLSWRHSTNFDKGKQQRALASHSAVKKRVYKLRRLGAVESIRNPRTDEVLWGITPYGYQYAEQSVGRSLELNRLDGMAEFAVNHARNVARVAAQLACPEGRFRESLGIEPADMDMLFSESYIQKCFRAITVKGEDWGQNRLDQLNKAKAAVEDKFIETSEELWTMYPSLLTIAWPESQRVEGMRAYKYPDLAALCPASGGGMRGIWGEIEVSLKPLPEYASIMAAIDMELKRGPTYQQVVYFTTHRRLEKLLRRADNENGTRLFEEGKLAVVMLNDADGNEVEGTKRLRVQAR